jgi:hypothetical protein
VRSSGASSGRLLPRACAGATVELA